MTFRIFAALAVLVAFPVSAHHSVNSFFDLNDPISVEGTLTSIRWANPHVRLSMERIGESGEMEQWSIESGGPTLLRRLGVTEELVELGDRVTVSGFPSRRDDEAMVGASLALPDGREVPLFPTLAGHFGHEIRSGVHITDDAAAAASADGIFRVWTFESGDASVPDAILTEAALAGRAEFDPLIDDLALQCIAPGMQIAMDNPFPIEFVDNGNEIVLRLEVWDNVRTIHLDEALASAPSERSPLGFSVGRWEGRTLSVETTAINWPFFDDDGTPQSEAVEVVERFTLSADDTRLHYEAVITDPATLLEPATRSMNWRWVPGEVLQSYNCTL